MINRQLTYSQLIEGLLPIVVEASNIIVKVYGSSFTVHNKSDGSPVSDADLKANAIILSGLSLLTPDIPVVSEESGVLEYAQRRLWKRYWLVDPLDGTREFIQGCDQFTTHTCGCMYYQKESLNVMKSPLSRQNTAFLASSRIRLAP